jgi:chemotaxis protein methyltransferase CheR
MGILPVIDLEENIEITPEEYELVRKLIYDRAGINLGNNRQHLVQARLAKRIRVKGLSGFREYFQYLQSDRSGEEMVHLTDAISTNTTFFFREADHFDFLAKSIVSRIKEERWEEKKYLIRIWSAASSSGEEPYTIAMVVQKVLSEYPMIDFKILATDISQKILGQAIAGQYEAQKLKMIPDEYRRNSFRPVSGSKGELFEVSPELKRKITFANFNLMTPEYPFKFGFDYVFCRNVMIYFDRQTQEAVVNRISKHIRPGGYLIVGHSESLNGFSHKLKYIKPTIYLQG